MRKTSSPSEAVPSSSPSSSAQLSSPEFASPGHSSSYSSPSPSSYPLSATSLPVEEIEPVLLELAIQYGKGRSPLSFLPPSFVDAADAQRTHDSDDESSCGSITLSIPIEAQLANSSIRGADAPGTCNGTNNMINATQIRIRIRWYKFQPSLSTEMQRADIILCHAGAGTLLEALAISNSTQSTAKRKIINAVINSKLMDNHQSELGEELERRNHIRVTRECTVEWTTEEGATHFWKEIGEFSPVPFSGGRNGDEREGDCNEHVHSFRGIVDRVMGFHGTNI